MSNLYKLCLAFEKASQNMSVDPNASYAFPREPNQSIPIGPPRSPRPPQNLPGVPSSVPITNTAPSKLPPLVQENLMLLGLLTIQDASGFLDKKTVDALNKFKASRGIKGNISSSQLYGLLDEEAKLVGKKTQVNTNQKPLINDLVNDTARPIPGPLPR